MDPRQLRDRLERARREGARAAELLYEHTTGHGLAVTRGKLVPDAPALEERVTVRVWIDGGRTATKAGSPGAVDTLVDQALAKAAKAKEDPHAGPVARQQAVLGGLGVCDRRYDQVTDQDRDEVLTTAERAVRQVDKRLTASGFAYGDVLRLRRFASTRGVFLEETDTVYFAQGTVSAPSGRDPVVLTERIESRTFASIASLPFGTSVARRAADLLQPLVDLDGEVRVLLPPLAVARLFAALAERFDAASFGDAGRFFLQPRPDGKPAVDTRLHLQDDGTLPGGLRTRSFDDRGVCPVPLTLLREGRVDGRFVGPERAHAHDVRPTGHVTADGQAPTNLLLRSGTRSMNATLADLGGRVLAVDDLPDLGRVDFRTGKFVAKVHGVVLDANRPIGAVRSRTLTGDLSRVLNGLVEVCSDTDRIGHVDAPGMVLDGFSLD